MVEVAIITRPALFFPHPAAWRRGLYAAVVLAVAGFATMVSRYGGSWRVRQVLKATHCGHSAAPGRSAACRKRAPTGLPGRWDLGSRIGAGNPGLRGLWPRSLPRVRQVRPEEPDSLSGDGQACYAVGVAE